MSVQRAKIIECWEHRIAIEAIDEKSFKGVGIALFSAGGDRSKQWCPVSDASGCVAIDNSNAWRIDPEVPLVVPEVYAD